MKYRRILLAVSAAALLTGAGVGAEALTGQALVDHRIAELKKVAGAMQAIGPLVQSGDLSKASEAAAVIAAAGPLLKADWFPAGTGTGDAGISKTRALAVIWSDRADFDAKADAYTGAGAALAAALAAGDASNFGALMQATGGSCKACHEKYRQPDL